MAPQTDEPQPTQPTQPNPEQSVTPPDNNPPVVPTPTYVPTPTPNQAPLTPIKPRTNRKKLLAIIIAAVMLVLAVGTYSAYAFWYSNPQKVTTDAFRTVLTTKSAVYKGSLQYKPAESSAGAITVDFDGQSDQESSQVNLKLNVDMAPMNFKFGSSFISTKAGDVYFKIDNAKAILDTAGAFLGGTPEVTTALQGVSEKLDNKWVKMTAADLKELNSSGDDQQTVCLQKAIVDFQNSESQQDQIFKAFSDNRFVKTDKQIGSETINGSASNGYELSFDDKKAKSFGKAAEQTDVIKAIQKCVGDEAKTDDNDSSEDIKPGETTKVEVWADKWSHNLTRVRVTSSDKDSGSLTFNFEPQLNKPANVTAPTGNVTQFKDLKASIESIFPTSMLGPSGSAEAFDLSTELNTGLES